MTHAIETVDLTRRFRRIEAVEGVNLRVPSGSIFALVGPNGAGKTTMIKLLMNLMRPTRGSATVLGEDSRRLGTATFKRIGYVSENQHLPEHMTAAQLLDYCRPFYPTWDDNLCRELQTQMRLPLNQSVRTMSRGMRMKAALLSSLAYRPDLIVLDEPFSGLDPLVRDELIRALLELSGDGSPTVFISSHDTDELERLADWVGLLDGGRLIFAEPVASLLARYRAIEVVAADEPPVPVTTPEWIIQGASGRTLKFIDTNHAVPDADARIAAAYPRAEIHSLPLSLREIFVLHARRSATTSQRGDAV